MSDSSEGESHRPVARHGMGSHVEICFPDRSETLILSEDIARELAEEMLEIVEIVEEESDNDE